MYQSSMFEVSDSYARLDKAGDPLHKLQKRIDWEDLRPVLKGITFDRTAKGGRPALDPVLVVKCLIIQACYQLSDEALEYQINDRLSFKRFIGIDVNEKSPDAKSFWLYRERLKEQGLHEDIFGWFDHQLIQNRLIAQKGQIVDATFVESPKPTGKHTKQLKQGVALTSHQQAQIDQDATHTKKGNAHHHGYKNHIGVDVKHKLIRTFTITTASTHDSQVFEGLIDETNTGRDVYGDAAYKSEKSDQMIRGKKLYSQVHYRAWKNRPLTKTQERTNKNRSSIRARVEHVFGHMINSMGGLTIHTMGLPRATVKMTFKNLAYNMQRFAFLMGQKLQVKCV